MADRLDAVLQLLCDRHGNVTETEAAALLNVSAVWFRHTFKRRTKTSFRRARLSAKLEYGARLLQQTDMPIKEITELLGYWDRTKFEKAFKRAYGLTPAIFRSVQHHYSRIEPKTPGPTGQGIDPNQPPQ